MEVCKVCGSAICLQLSKKNEAYLEQGWSDRNKFFADPSNFGVQENAKNVCSTTGKSRDFVKV